MDFTSIINAAVSAEADRPLMQKDIYAIEHPMRNYLLHYGREKKLPINYRDLHTYKYADAIRDSNDKLTHWETATYDASFQEILHQQLKETYLLLTGLNDATPTLQITTIDFCEFGNSVPFRIGIISLEQHWKDTFYVKQADASRIFGLELEHLLTNNVIRFMCNHNTLIEKHIDGMPGDEFLKTHFLTLNDTSKQLLANAFIAFNTASFARLLGDMRNYNFVINTTADEQQQPAYHFRAIDFDQQCYEGRLKLYWPQFYRENYPFVKNVQDIYSKTEIKTIQHQQAQQFIRLYQKNATQIRALLNALMQAEISENYKVKQLAADLNQFYGNQDFSNCTTMASIVDVQIKAQLHYFQANELKE